MKEETREAVQELQELVQAEAASGQGRRGRGGEGAGEKTAPSSCASSVAHEVRRGGAPYELLRGEAPGRLWGLGEWEGEGHGGGVDPHPGTEETGHSTSLPCSMK